MSKTSNEIYNKQLTLQKYSIFKIRIIFEVTPFGLIKVFDINNKIQLIPTIKFPNEIFKINDLIYELQIHIFNDNIINLYGLNLKIKDITTERINNITLDSNKLSTNYELGLFYLNKKSTLYNKILDKNKLLKNNDMLDDIFEKTNINCRNIIEKTFIKNNDKNILIILDKTIQYHNTFNGLFWHNISTELHKKGFNMFICNKPSINIDKKKINGNLDDINYIYLGPLGDVLMSEYIISYTNKLLLLCKEKNIKLIHVSDYLSGIAVYNLSKLIDIKYIYENFDNYQILFDDDLLRKKLEDISIDKCSINLVRYPIVGENIKKIYIPYSTINYVLINTSKKNKLNICYIGIDVTDNANNIIKFLKLVSRFGQNIILILDENIINKQINNYKKNNNLQIRLVKDFKNLDKLCQDIDIFIFMENSNDQNIIYTMSFNKPIICHSKFIYKTNINLYDNVDDIPNIINKIIDKSNYNINYDINKHFEIIDKYVDLINLCI